MAVARTKLLNFILPVDNIDVSFGFCLIKHCDKAADLIDKGACALDSRFFELVGKIAIKHVVDANFIAAERADKEQFTVINLEGDQFAKTFNFRPNSCDIERV